MKGPNPGEEREEEAGETEELIEGSLDGDEGGGGSYGHPREEDDDEDKTKDEDL